MCVSYVVCVCIVVFAALPIVSHTPWQRSTGGGVRGTELYLRVKTTVGNYGKCAVYAHVCMCPSPCTRALHRVATNPGLLGRYC